MRWRCLGSFVKRFGHASKTSHRFLMLDSTLPLVMMMHLQHRCRTWRWRRWWCHGSKSSFRFAVSFAATRRGQSFAATRRGRYPGKLWTRRHLHTVLTQRTHPLQSLLRFPRCTTSTHQLSTFPTVMPSTEQNTESDITHSLRFECYVSVL